MLLRKGLRLILGFSLGESGAMPRWERQRSSPVPRVSFVEWRKRWLVTVGMMLVALFSASCGSDQIGTPAADFTLELATEGTFALSEQTKPVLVVFWAEW